MSSPALVIGGGHNGLIASLVLAQRGLSVRLLESRDELGGVAGSWEFGQLSIPGCSTTPAA